MNKNNSYSNQFSYTSQKIYFNIGTLKEGLEPEILAYWYKRIEDKAIEIVPPHLKDKIQFEQDRILWMKFKINVSKRTVQYILQVIEEFVPIMPYSTGLYFRQVQQALTDELNKELC